MAFDGVAAGAKMFVGLKGGAGTAEAEAEQHTQTRLCASGAPQLFGFDDNNCNPLKSAEHPTDGWSLKWPVNFGWQTSAAFVSMAQQARGLPSYLCRGPARVPSVGSAASDFRREEVSASRQLCLLVSAT
jgi:hypothetical protein